MPQARKKKKCKVCGDLYLPFTSFQTVCGEISCALEQVGRDKEKKASKELRLARKRTREDKERIKPRAKWMKEAQEKCNAFIRDRDKDELCISCQKPPKKKNAGHYLSVGSHPELRFHPFNINLQCEHCNSWKSGNAIEYRINLINKIGLDNVEWLEGPHQAQKWTIEDLKEIKAYYREQIKLLKQ